MNDRSFFKNKKVARPKFMEIAEGEHIVRVTSMLETDSFHSYDGTLKQNLTDAHPWDNATPQLAVTMVVAEDGKHGGITHRFNGCGYVKFEDLSEKQIKTGKYFDLKGYACYEDKIDGEKVVLRLESEENIESCDNILNQFAMALGLEVEADLLDSIEQAIAEQKTFKITVVNDTYFEGKDQKKVSKFKALSKVAETQFEE